MTRDDFTSYYAQTKTQHLHPSHHFSTNQFTNSHSHNENTHFTGSQSTSIEQQNNQQPSIIASQNNTTATATNVTSISSPISSLPTPPLTSNPNPNPAVLSNNFDLQEILSQFGAQPDILKLILTSKVEEDKRRSEEAKLRLRELDLILLERYRQRFEDIHGNLGAYLAPDGSLTYASFSSGLISPLQNISVDSSTNNNNSTSHSVNHPKCIVRVKLPLKSESTSQDQLTSQNDLNSNNNSNDNSNNNNDNDDLEDCGMNDIPSKRKRKRREMLPVTMIIETKENPYKDDYLWKNNGNTIQRKTGNKSIYYKCSNSNKGCPVNKTVTEKEDGWMIKYRGHHLEDCGKIKRIVQS